MKKLNNKEEIDIALDISTTCIGISIFKNSDNSLIEVNHLVLKTDPAIDVDNRYIAKSNMFKEYVLSLKDKYDVKKILVEQPLFSSNNVFTVAVLLRFNGICCYTLYQELGCIPVLLTVHEIRKAICPELIKHSVKKGKPYETLSFPKDVDKKEYIFKKISAKHPDIQWPMDKKGNLSKYSYDISDSLAIYYAAIQLNK